MNGLLPPMESSTGAAILFYIFALMGLLINLISDLTYTWVDPRIDFETREV